VIYVSPGGQATPEDYRLWPAAGVKNPGFMIPEPALSGLELCPRKWAAALLDSGVSALFITRLPLIAMLGSAHSKDDWPLEDSWARAAPSLFKLVYEDFYCRVYALRPEGRDALSVLADDCERRPPDAWACRRDPDSCRRYFPLAGKAMDGLRLAWPGEGK